MVRFGVWIALVGCLGAQASTDWRDGVLADTSQVLTHLEDFGDLLWDGKACPVHVQVIEVHQDLSDFFYGVSGNWPFSRCRSEFRIACHSLAKLTKLVAHSCKPIEKDPLKASWNGVVLSYRRLHSWFRCGEH